MGLPLLVSFSFAIWWVLALTQGCQVVRESERGPVVSLDAVWLPYNQLFSLWSFSGIYNLQFYLYTKHITFAIFHSKYAHTKQLIRPIHLYLSAAFSTLYYISLHFTTLIITTLQFTTHGSTSFHCTAPLCASPHFTSLHFTTLYYISLHFTTLISTTLIITTLHGSTHFTAHDTTSQHFSAKKLLF